MQSLSLFSPVSMPLCTKKNSFVSTSIARFRTNGSINGSAIHAHVPSRCAVLSNQFLFNPMRHSMINQQKSLMKNIHKRRSSGVVCYYGGAVAPLYLEWVSVLATATLMLIKGTAINKAFLVPLFALQAPAAVIAWIKGEFGAWSAFLALMVRLFFFIPGELELPLMALLLVIAAPLQAVRLRGTPPGIVISLAISGYLAFQHFSSLGSLQKAFEQGAIVATMAVLSITLVPLLLLI